MTDLNKILSVIDDSLDQILYGEPDNAFKMLWRLRQEFSKNEKQDVDCLFASFHTMRSLVEKGKIQEALTIPLCISAQKHNHPWFKKESNE